MSRIFLIRHGETSANSELRYQGQIDTPLNNLGLQQAKQLAQDLKNVPLSKIYTSDLKRAYTTAQIIAKPHHIKIKKFPKLRERNYSEGKHPRILLPCIRL